MPSAVFTQRMAAFDHRPPDRFGIVLREVGDVDVWFRFLRSQGMPVEAEPRNHRDGARSFYCSDPAGNRVQMTYHPSVSDTVANRERDITALG